MSFCPLRPFLCFPTRPFYAMLLPISSFLLSWIPCLLTFHLFSAPHPLSSFISACIRTALFLKSSRTLSSHLLLGEPLLVGIYPLLLVKFCFTVSFLFSLDFKIILYYFFSYCLSLNGLNFLDQLFP